MSLLVRVQHGLGTRCYPVPVIVPLCHYLYECSMDLVAGVIRPLSLCHYVITCTSAAWTWHPVLSGPCHCAIMSLLVRVQHGLGSRCYPAPVIVPLCHYLYECSMDLAPGVTRSLSLCHYVITCTSAAWTWHP